MFSKEMRSDDTNVNTCTFWNVAVSLSSPSKKMLQLCQHVIVKILMDVREWQNDISAAVSSPVLW